MKILGITALVGWLPFLLCLLAVQYATAYGARDWPNVVFGSVFVGLYLMLLGAGAYIYTTWFKR